MLSNEQELTLVDFLVRNWDNFAWKPFDMLGILREVAEQSLDILPDAKLVKQRLCCFDDEKRKAIEEEIARLFASGFVTTRVHYILGSHFDHPNE